MKLVVFDLDGTLTRTYGVDGECFVQAAESLGIKSMNSNWSEYEHVTDSGVIHQSFTENFGRPPQPAELSNFIEYFVCLLKERYRTSVCLFSEVPGAASFLNSLGNASHWGVAIATGSWERSARFKIETTGLPAAHLPAAFAEDGPSRESIVKTAIARASVFYRCQQFEKIVSVGDAVWDLQTAKQLGLPFIGVGNQERGTILRTLGARQILENFLDRDHCLSRLEAAVYDRGSAKIMG